MLVAASWLSSCLSSPRASAECVAPLTSAIPIPPFPFPPAPGPRSSTSLPGPRRHPSPAEPRTRVQDSPRARTISFPVCRTGRLWRTPRATPRMAAPAPAPAREGARCVRSSGKCVVGLRFPARPCPCPQNCVRRCSTVLNRLVCGGVCPVACSADLLTKPYSGVHCSASLSFFPAPVFPTVSI